RLDCFYRVLHSDEFTSGNILRRVSEIDESLNRQLRKGVEENLSRLLEQTTALEVLDRTQSSVHSEMNDVYETCDKFAKTLDSLLCDYRKLTLSLEQIISERNLTADALRCEGLVDSLEKRHEIVKRSEIVSEIKGVVADNPDLLSVTWLRETLKTTLKAVEKEVRRSAANDMRRGLASLNASLVASATRALANLGVLEAELEVYLASSTAEIDKEFLELSSNPDNSVRLVQQCVSHIHSQIDQFTLLGSNYLTKFIEGLVRSIRARVPLDAPFALKFVQQMSRMLIGSPDCVRPVADALRPLKTSILSQSLAKLHNVVEQHDLTSQSSIFVDLLVSTVEEEVRRFEWDSELRDATQRNVQKCLSMVAKRLESEIKLDPENLLFGDRLRNDQLKNYKLLEVANSLTNKWPAQAAPLLSFELECVSTIMDSIRGSIFAIIGSMHHEIVFEKSTSPYMQEFTEYVCRVERHFSHFYSTIKSTYSLSLLADYIIQVFMLNATLLRPLSDRIRQQLFADLETFYFSLLNVVDAKLAPSRKYPDRIQLRSVFSCVSQETEYELMMSSPLPAWIYIHLLIADSPASLLSPHVSVEWTVDQYVKWCSEHSDGEIVSFLSGLLTSYTTSVISRHETKYVPHYPRIMELIRKSAS
ncbi:unnamed protein product, partial [Angiostrongylus costaricensis]|uniref:Conserved oligomeric Golgi complex subunit 5 n=1 Tax=Angiostrongylus costaricensis TaxID=334426 RepID=A0A158PKZ9_ANGCS